MIMGSCYLCIPVFLLRLYTVLYVVDVLNGVLVCAVRRIEEGGKRDLRGGVAVRGADIWGCWGMV